MLTKVDTCHIQDQEITDDDIVHVNALIEPALSAESKQLEILLRYLLDVEISNPPWTRELISGPQL